MATNRKPEKTNTKGLLTPKTICLLRAVLPDGVTCSFKKGDIAKLDLGVMVDGYVADSAVSIDLGDNEKLVKASVDALNNAIKTIRVGVALGEIGKDKSDEVLPILNELVEDEYYWVRRNAKSSIKSILQNPKNESKNKRYHKGIQNRLV